MPQIIQTNSIQTITILMITTITACLTLFLERTKSLLIMRTRRIIMSITTVVIQIPILNSMVSMRLNKMEPSKPIKSTVVAVLNTLTHHPIQTSMHNLNRS